jgi:hypothetical protein
MKTIDVEITNIDLNISILEQGLQLENIKNNITNNRYEPKVALEDKVYL